MDTRLRCPPLNWRTARSAAGPEVEILQHLFDPLQPLRIRGVTRHPQARRVVESAADRKLPVDYVVLRDVTQIVAVGVEVVIEVDAVEQDCSSAGRTEAAQSVE